MKNHKIIKIMLSFMFVSLVLLASCNQVKQESDQQQLQEIQPTNQEDVQQIESEVDEVANELSDSFIDESESIIAGDLI